MSKTIETDSMPWLLLVFTLPANRASARVGIWRKLQRYGALALRNSGYLLPNTATNHERFAWLATSIRGSKGEASVLQVRSLDDPPVERLRNLFREERSPDYNALIQEVHKLDRSARGFPNQLAKAKRRFDEISEIDFFDCPLRSTAEQALHKVEHAATHHVEVTRGKLSKMAYEKRAWITRPRPGIDRVSSAWLIQRFIDPKAAFMFGNGPGTHPKAVPFDMYEGDGFGHEGENCTFETLCLHFGIRDKVVHRIAQAIHDADFDDGKFGRTEGTTINQVLKGWAKQGIQDDELLRRGMDLIEGLYRSIPSK
jgi:hypothetical protein